MRSRKRPKHGRSLLQSAAEVAPHLPRLEVLLGVTVEASTIAGVRVFVVTPNSLAPGNRDRLLPHLHGGGYVLWLGEAGAGTAMLMAGFGRFEVILVDHRMPPDAPRPAALGDALAVWRAMLGMADPRRMAVFGISAGGLTPGLMRRDRPAGKPEPHYERRMRCPTCSGCASPLAP